MVYFIIGIVLLVIVVPIFSVLPSARQRQQMKMRQGARAAGVSVDLTTIDDPNPEQDKYISHTGRSIPARLNVAGYRIQRRRQQNWRRLPEVDWCLKRKLHGVSGRQVRRHGTIKHEGRLRRMLRGKVRHCHRAKQRRQRLSIGMLRRQVRHRMEQSHQGSPEHGYRAHRAARCPRADPSLGPG